MFGVYLLKDRDRSQALCVYLIPTFTIGCFGYADFNESPYFS